MAAQQRFLRSSSKASRSDVAGTTLLVRFGLASSDSCAATKMHFLACLLAISSFLSLSFGGKHPGKKVFERAERLKRNAIAKHAPHDEPRQQEPATVHKFLTNKTKPFAVEGKAIPKVPFDMGESYAGAWCI